MSVLLVTSGSRGFGAGVARSAAERLARRHKLHLKRGEHTGHRRIRPHARGGGLSDQGRCVQSRRCQGFAQPDGGGTRPHHGHGEGSGEDQSSLAGYCSRGHAQWTSRRSGVRRKCRIVAFVRGRAPFNGIDYRYLRRACHPVRFYGKGALSSSLSRLAAVSAAPSSAASANRCCAR